MNQKPNRPPTHEDYPLTFLSGAFLGVLLGGLLTLWYAPRSGAQTLAQIRGWLGLGEISLPSFPERRALAPLNRPRLPENIDDEF